MNAWAITDGFVATILGIWLFLTVAWNIPRLDVAVVRHLPVGRWLQLVPLWSFFAPRPVNRDYLLFYRDRYDTGSVSAWREVLITDGAWTPRRAIWNPGSRPRKALADAVRYLLRLARDERNSGGILSVSVPYLLLLNKVSSLPAEVGVTGRQFSIMGHSIAKPRPEVVFVSHMHDLA
jgi:hypothetical protein